jgi:hypothetical protein
MGVKRQEDIYLCFFFFYYYYQLCNSLMLEDPNTREFSFDARCMRNEFSLHVRKTLNFFLIDKGLS